MKNLVLILILVEDGRRHFYRSSYYRSYRGVLILILVEDGRRHFLLWRKKQEKPCLNPYSSGRWSKTVLFDYDGGAQRSLNPYSSGRWSKTERVIDNCLLNVSLNPYSSGRWSKTCDSVYVTYRGKDVLILILVEDGRRRSRLAGVKHCNCCLNPYSSGRWSKT